MEVKIVKKRSYHTLHNHLISILTNICLKTNIQHSNSFFIINRFPKSKKETIKSL